MTSARRMTRRLERGIGAGAMLVHLHIQRSLHERLQMLGSGRAFLGEWRIDYDQGDEYALDEMHVIFVTPEFSAGGRTLYTENIRQWYAAPVTFDDVQAELYEQMRREGTSPQVAAALAKRAAA
jgi:hypothetical protein